MDLHGREVSTMGEISFHQNRICWKIPNFYSLPQETNLIIYSPELFVMERYCRMSTEPYSCLLTEEGNNRLLIRVSEKHVPGLTFAITEPRFNLKVGITGKHKELSIICTSCKTFNICVSPMSSLDLDKEKKNWIREGNLHLFSSVEKIGDKAEAKIFSCTSPEEGIKTLQEDLKDTLQKGHFSDVILRVDNREFKSHRCILASRSPVFMAMLTHETKEKNTRIIDIQDVDPNTFASFLEYIYTGNIESITSENAEKLYRAAHKYQVHELRKTCMEYMLKNVSIDNYCDVLTLSLLHEEKDLTEACTQFFIKNSLVIIKTSKWKIFLSENPMVGNELFMKQLELNK